ncbi:MAG: HAMP domain-containing sensor histidine kinase [Kofleriaceae bacterium]
MTFSIRSALLAVAVLGLVTCGLALFALARPLAAANTGRNERARGAVEAEVRRLHRAGPEPTSGPGRGTTRSGFASPTETFEALGLPWPNAPEALRGLLAASQRTNTLTSDHLETADGVLFVAIEPTGDKDRYAWAAYVMSPPRTTPVLRVVGIALDLVALALAIAAMFAVLVVRRGADALTRCLALLGRDLSTPVPRSRVTELNKVADGISDLARDLARTQNELAERERIAVLGRVTAGVAHELRNPLAVMKLRIDLMRRNPKVPSEITPELDIVVEEVVRLDRLVNDLLTVAGRRLSEQRQLEIGELVSRRVELIRQLAAEQHVAIEVSGSATARVDPDAITRVIDNVLKNAIEASPSGAAVRIEVGSDDRGAWLRCSDRGGGVPPEREDELFEPFFTTKPEGVGLGLALSRAIAAAHGGTLTYMREHDSTVFELRLVGAP